MPDAFVYLTRSCFAGTKKHGGPVAQLVEHVTFNHRVLGSSPSRITTPSFHGLLRKPFFISRTPSGSFRRNLNFIRP